MEIKPRQRWNQTVTESHEVRSYCNRDEGQGQGKLLDLLGEALSSFTSSLSQAQQC